MSADHYRVGGALDKLGEAKKVLDVSADHYRVGGALSFAGMGMKVE